MKKIILITPPSSCVEDDHLEPQLGLLYIAAVLRENNFLPEIYDMTGCRNDEEIDQKIRNIPHGDIYGITCYCTNYNYVKKCIREIKSNNRGARIALGGPNPSALPDFTLKDSACDCVITGEGEDAFLEYIERYSQGSGSPLIIKGEGRQNIDSYPFPARDLVDIDSYSRVLEGGKAATAISSRGCNFNCIHCNSIVMGRYAKVRFRSSRNITDEIKLLKSQGFMRLRFNDDNFTANPHLTELLYEIKKLNILYRIFSRIEFLTEENCRLLAQSGCRHISIGLESLNPENLKIIGKYSQSGIEERNLRNCKNSGITTRAYFIVGLPYDHDSSIQKDFTTAAHLPFDEFSIYPLIPYPGTLISEKPEKFGYEIIDNDFTGYVQIGKNRRTAFALRHKNFNEEDVRKWHEFAHTLFISAGKVPQKESKTAV